MTWLTRWEPEDPKFWKEEGAPRAWLTLLLTTFSLIASFATWFVFSAIAVRLPSVGFKFSTMELFWLTAMPGLSGGTLRLIHTFLIPIFGTRRTISVATVLKILPMVWLGFAVQDPSTPYLHFLVIAFLCGMGGGDFSSYMPSTSLFFPKRLQGTALGIQAGVGNLGVSIVQFISPWIILLLDPGIRLVADGHERGDDEFGLAPERRAVVRALPRHRGCALRALPA
jgi:NNP family nitrate/nitrite transporter-like MFS transporter